jgi:hypothetical protein
MPHGSATGWPREKKVIKERRVDFSAAADVIQLIGDSTMLLRGDQQ